MAAARLGMAALADVDGLSAAKDPADTIQGALDRWRDDFNARPATGINVKMGADHFLLQIGIRSAIFGMEANAERAEEFDASAGNPADGHCPVSLRFVKGAAIPARSASQSRVDTGSTSRAPGPIPAALPPGYTRHITYSDGRFTLPDGSTVPADPNGGFTISTGAYIPPDGAGGIILPNGARCISDSARGYFCP